MMRQEDKTKIAVYYRSLIIDICSKANLPLPVRGSAIRIFDRALKEILTSDLRNLAYMAIILGSKCEDVHSGLDSLITSLPHSNPDALWQLEDEMYRKLDFKLNLPCYYLKMYGILVLLQERNLIDVKNASVDIIEMPKECHNTELFKWVHGKCTVESLNDVWCCSVRQMDRMLLLDKEFCTDIDLVFASLQLPNEVIGKLNFDYSYERIKQLREMASGLVIPSTHEIEHSE